MKYENVNFLFHGMNTNKSIRRWKIFMEGLYWEQFTSDRMRWNKGEVINMGLSANGQILVLTHTERRARIRIISCRKATAKERKFYVIRVAHPKKKVRKVWISRENICHKSVIIHLFFLTEPLYSYNAQHATLRAFDGVWHFRETVPSAIPDNQTNKTHPAGRPV